MPLPPALAARLAKRGIVKVTPISTPVNVKENKNKNKKDDEEVFAEDYDDMLKDENVTTESEEPASVPSPIETPADEEEDGYDANEPIIAEVINCPIKVNPYHECTDYCTKTYGLKQFEPDLKMLKLRERMLRRFPLPVNWREVADPVANRYYYWNMMTDQVSWLSPTHPGATVTLPAERLQGLLSEKDNLSDQGDEEEEKMDEGSDLSDDDSMTGSDSDVEEVIPERNDRKRSQDYVRRDRGEATGAERGRGRGGRKKEELDPMDPASYSEAPRGTWSSGLEQRGVAKTGVDSTAAGPLFQQRPYPSPGAVLRANRQLEESN